MEANEEELLENVTDDSGNSYMIQRMTVDNTQLLNSDLLQTSNGIVVDLGGDFIPVNYTSEEDLLSHDITEEDRNLAAALVAVQFSHQQKQQQTQQDGSVIINTSLPSLMSSFDGTKVRLGEQQVLVQDKQTGLIQIVDAEDLYKDNFAKYDKNTGTLQLIKTEDEQVITTNSTTNTRKKAAKRILPHKKRIAKKVKKPETFTEIQKCSFCEQLFTLEKIDDHQAVCQNNVTTTITANGFACQICNGNFGDQLSFFEHLKVHYEPNNVSEIIEEEITHEESEEIEEIVQEEIEEEEEQEEEDADMSPTEITIFKEEDLMLEHPEGTIIKIEPENEEDEDEQTRDAFLSAIILTCMQCNKTFRKQKSYETHMQEYHGQTEICDFAEGEDGSLIRINISAEKEEPIDSKEWYRDDELHATEEDLKELEANEDTCPNCHQHFPVRAMLVKHLISCQDPDEPPPKIVKIKSEGGRKKGKNKNLTERECNICGRRFTHKNSLIYHMRSHADERPFQCEQCGKSFFAASALKVHLRLHSGEKPYSCDYCDKHFRQWGDLKYHCVSLHSDEKEYQCEYCGKEFARKYSLIVHRRIHTGEKNYRCEFCGKTFRASSYLQNHRRIHTGEKPHPCDICGKRFRVRSDMKRHMRTHTNRRGKSPNLASAQVKIEPHVLQQESEDTSESMTLMKEEPEGAVQTLEYESETALDSIRDPNTLYVQMPVLIT